MAGEGFRTDTGFSKYGGKYVTIVGRKIIASGYDVGKIIEETKKKYPKEKIELMKVAKPETLVLMVCRQNFRSSGRGQTSWSSCSGLLPRLC